MIYTKKNGFTLVELMIVIVIMVGVMILTYAPYSYFQNKAKLKIASSEISQAILEGRNLAVSGINTLSGSVSENKSVGVFLDNSEGKNGQIYFFVYPYSVKASDLSFPDFNLNLFKKKSLQDGVLINGDKSLFFFFEAISGDSTVLSFENNSSNGQVLTGSVEINFSFRNSTSESLQKTMEYNIKTNITNIVN